MDSAQCCVSGTAPNACPCLAFEAETHRKSQHFVFCRPQPTHSFLLSHLHETNGYAAAFSVPCMLFLASLNFAKTRCDAAWLKNFPGML
jgi:hypothetical protein